MSYYRPLLLSPITPTIYQTPLGGVKFEIDAAHMYNKRPVSNRRHLPSPPPPPPKTNKQTNKTKQNKNKNRLRLKKTLFEAKLQKLIEGLGFLGCIGLRIVSCSILPHTEL